MHNFKRKIKVIFALGVIAVILFGLDFMLYPCTFMRNDIHTVCTEPKQDIFLGTSHGKLNIDPDIVGDITGKTGHNLCVGGEYGIDAYYLTKLVMEKQKPERIIYEVDPGYFVMEKEPGNNYLLFYHEFPFSKAKLEYFGASMLECDFRSVLFPWYEYPLEYEIEKIPDTVYQKVHQNYDVAYLKGAAQEYHENGFIERYPVDVSKLELTEPKLFTKQDVKQKNMEYLENLINLCKEEGVEFVAVTTPVPDPLLDLYDNNYKEAWEYFEAFFAEHEIRYLNFNTEYYEFFSHNLINYTDFDGHMNGEAAEKYSEILGYLLQV